MVIGFYNLFRIWWYPSSRFERAYSWKPIRQRRVELTWHPNSSVLFLPVPKYVRFPEMLRNLDTTGGIGCGRCLVILNMTTIFNTPLFILGGMGYSLRNPERLSPTSKGDIVVVIIPGQCDFFMLNEVGYYFWHVLLLTFICTFPENLRSIGTTDLSLVRPSVMIESSHLVRRPLAPVVTRPDQGFPEF